jgi:hypothetical protein
MNEYLIERVVSEELERSVLGPEPGEESGFVAQVSDQPIGLNLRSLFADLGNNIPPEVTLYKQFEVWLIPHRFSLIRRRGLAEPTYVGLVVEYIHENATCSVISLIPGPAMQQHGKIHFGADYSGNLSATGAVSSGQLLTGVPDMIHGALGFRVATDGGLAFRFEAVVSTPVVSAVGIGSSRCEWGFEKREEPLFGKTIETWSVLVLPKRRKELRYRIKYYYLVRTLFFATRRESDFIEVVCPLP